jgi:hypothetical protein
MVDSLMKFYGAKKTVCRFAWLPFVSTPERQARFRMVIAGWSREAKIFAYIATRYFW